MSNSRSIRLILAVLMLFWLFFIPQIIYFFIAKPRNGATIRLILWVLALIPITNLIGAIGLILIEARIIDVDSRR